MGLRAAPHMLVPVGDGVAVRVRVGDAVVDGVPLLHDVPVADVVGDLLAVGDDEGDGVLEADGVGDRLAVSDDEGDGVTDAEPVLERVPLGVSVKEAVGVADLDDDPDGGGVTEGAGVELPLGGNACASERTPPPLARTGRPRTLRPVVRRPASMAAAASQLPAAAAPPGMALRRTPLRDCMSGCSPVTLEKSKQLASDSTGDSMPPHAESADCHSGAAAYWLVPNE
jgi:hypothetical protein